MGCSAKDVNIVLMGADLDIMSGLTINKAQPRLVLTAFDRHGDLQYENDSLHLSLRGGTPGSKEHQIERLTLAVSRLDVPEVLGQDFCYIFSSREQEIQTSNATGEILRKRFELYARRTSERLTVQLHIFETFGLYSS